MRGRGEDSSRWEGTSGQGDPRIRLDCRHEPKAPGPSARPSDHDIALVWVQAGGVVDGGAVRDQHRVRLVARTNSEQPSQPLALTVSRLREELGREKRARGAEATERQACRFARSAEWARKHLAHRDLQAPKGAADRARLATPLRAQVPLPRAVAQVACGVDPGVGGRVTEHQDVAACAQPLQKSLRGASAGLLLAGDSTLVSGALIARIEVTAAR